MLHGSTNRFEPCELDQNIPPVCVFFYVCECVFLYILKHLYERERESVVCEYGITSSQTGQTPRCDRGASSTSRALSLVSDPFSIVSSDAVCRLAALAGVDLRAETGDSLSFVLAVRHASW
jgi:hypothetical protein